MTGLGSDHTLSSAPQTTRNYAWRDYGNRVGLWYLFDLLDELRIPASHNINAKVLEYCPQIKNAFSFEVMKLLAMASLIQSVKTLWMKKPNTQ